MPLNQNTIVYRYAINIGSENDNITSEPRKEASFVNSVRLEHYHPHSVQSHYIIIIIIIFIYCNWADALGQWLYTCAQIWIRELIWLRRGGCMRRMQYQLGVLRTISAFSYRHRGTKKSCAEMGGRRTFSILTFSQRFYLQYITDFLRHSISNIRHLPPLENFNWRWICYPYLLHGAESFLRS